MTEALVPSVSQSAEYLYFRMTGACRKFHIVLDKSGHSTIYRATIGVAFEEGTSIRLFGKKREDSHGPLGQAVFPMEHLRHVQNDLDAPQADAADPLRELISQSQNLDMHLTGLLLDLEQVKDLDQFTGDVTAAYNRIKTTVGQAPDIILRKLEIGTNLKWPALIAFADGMVDNVIVDQDTLRMVELYNTIGADETDPEVVHDRVQYAMLTVGHVTTENRWDRLMDQLTYGSTLLFVQGASSVLVLDSVKFKSRAIARPDSEPSVKGPQEAFNEIMLTHMNQLRRRIRTARLRFEPITIGAYTKTTVILAHIEGLSNPALVTALTGRLHAIQRDSVVQINEIAPYLYDRRYTIFPQVRLTERVDWVARDLMSGKIAVMVDNDPFVITVPTTLTDFYQTTQDYVFSFWDGSLVRLVRLAGLIVGLFLMPLYIALTSVNPDLVPTKLLLTVDGSRQGIPFPPVSEVIIMWLIIEILREAANRLPKELAVTLGTVGAVVVGTAIVKAGIVDDIMIVTVTLTALGLFTTPTFEMTTPWRWLFWTFILGAYLLGVYGIMLASVLVITHLASLEEFGVPYLTPFGPLRRREVTDSWIRFPIPSFIKRPASLRPVDIGQAKRMDPSDTVPIYQGQKDTLE